MRKLIFILLAISALPLWAQDPQELPEVVVTAGRMETGILESPGFVTAIPVDPSLIQNVAEIIENQAGLSVKDYGLEGSLKTVSIRGSKAEQVLVLVDGVRLNSARDGGADLNLIPEANIERIEILRGGASSLYGADAIGGIINIITKKPSDFALNFKISNTSYIPHTASEVYEGMVTKAVDANFLDLVDAQKVEVSGSGLIGGLGISAGGTFIRAANSFVWNDTKYLMDWRRSINAALLSGTGFLGVLFPLLGGEVDLKGTILASDKGLPGRLADTGYNPPYWTITSDAKQTDLKATFNAGYRNEAFFADTSVLDLKSFFKYRNLGYTDPPLSSSSHGELSFGLDASHEYRWDWITAVYGIAVSYETVESTEIGKHDRFNGAGFVSVPVTFFDALTVTPSIRGDWFSDFGGAFGWKLSAVWMPLESFAVKANGAYSFRAPTLNDLYWPADPWTAGNPNLKPETAYTADLGLSCNFGTVSANIAGFLRYAMDEITWAPDPVTYTYMPLNIGLTFIPGIEADIMIKFFERFFLNGNYTFTYSFLLDDGSGHTLTFADNRRSPNVPIHKGGFSVGYADEENKVTVTGEAVSERFVNTANTQIVEGYFVLNVGYQRKFGKNVTANIELKNLLNAEYQIMAGYLTPPLSLHTGISVQL